MRQQQTPRWTWWHAPCGGKDVLAIALPMIVSTMSFVVMQFCDRLFLTWHSNQDLAAVVPSGALSWTITSFPLGIAMYAATFVAQYDGAKLTRKIGEIVWQAIWLGVLFAPLFVIAGYYSLYFFEWIGHSEELIWREAAYFNALCYGSPAVVINAAISSFFIGRGKTKTIMVVSILASAINILLDYLLIFGVQIGSAVVIAEGGIAGAGWATSLSVWIKLLILFAIFCNAANRREFNTMKYRFSNSSFLRLMNYGIPNGFQFVIEGGAITIFILIIARISETASAATALAFSINMIVFVPVLGLGIAVTTLVGQQIGDKKPELAVRATWTALWIGLPYTLVFGLAYFLVPEWFLMAHNMGTKEFAQVQDLAVTLLMFVAIYCMFDTVQLTFVSAIKGAGDTYFVVFFTIFSSAVFLLSGHYGADRFESSQTQISWWWTCLTLWIATLALVYFARFQQGRWKSMNVIGPDLVGTPDTNPV